jgi:hypothetical protein
LDIMAERDGYLDKARERWIVGYKGRERRLLGYNGRDKWILG